MMLSRASNRRPAAAENPRVLIVDDERDIHEDFEDMLSPRAASASEGLASVFVAEERSERRFDFDLLHAMSGDEAVAMVAAERRRQRPISVAYVDVRMPPGIDGVETARRIREIDREIEVVMMSAYADQRLSAVVHEMELRQTVRYVRKPFAREQVRQIAVALARKWRTAQGGTCATVCADHAGTASQNTSSHPWNTTIRPVKRTLGNWRARRSSAK